MTLYYRILIKANEDSQYLISCELKNFEIIPLSTTNTTWIKAVFRQPQDLVISNYELMNLDAINIYLSPTDLLPEKSIFTLAHKISG